MASHLHTHRRAAFTLVEVVIALAIVSFAILSMVALIPIGIGTFNDSVQISLSSDARQQALSSLQQANVGTLLNQKNPYTQINYLDQDGILLGTTTPTSTATFTTTPTYQMVITVTTNSMTSASGSFISAQGDPNGTASSLVNAAVVTTQFSRYLPAGTSTINSPATAADSSFRIGTDYLFYTNQPVIQAP